MENEELKPYLRLKNVFRELAVYRAFVLAAKTQGFQANIEGDGILDVDGILASARRSPHLEAWVDAHFPAFEKLLALPDESLADRTLRNLLEDSGLYQQAHDKSLGELD
jgi:hypothetical protein